MTPAIATPLKEIEPELEKLGLVIDSYQNGVLYLRVSKKSLKIDEALAAKLEALDERLRSSGELAGYQGYTVA